MFKRLLALAAIVAAAAAPAATITPANAFATIRAAACGSTVTLPPGDFGDLVVSNKSCPDAPVLLDTRAATLSLRIQGVNGLVVLGSEFKATKTNVGRGVVVDSSQHVTLLGGTVRVADNAVVVTRSSYVLVQGFETSGVIGNNLTVAGSHHVTVRGLVCRDATPDPTGAIHPDCVQAWSMPSRMTTDVLITGVDMVGPTQGIFFGDAGAGGYERVTITGNTVTGINAPNGISIRTPCADCSISDNRVSTLTGSKWQSTIYTVDPAVRRTGNVVAAHLRWRELRD